MRGMWTIALAVAMLQVVQSSMGEVKFEAWVGAQRSSSARDSVKGTFAAKTSASPELAWTNGSPFLNLVVRDVEGESQTPLLVYLLSPGSTPADASRPAVFAANFQKSQKSYSLSLDGRSKDVLTPLLMVVPRDTDVSLDVWVLLPGAKLWERMLRLSVELDDLRNQLALPRPRVSGTAELPDIYHTFGVPEKRSGAFLALLFTALSVAPLGALVLAWKQMGVLQRIRIPVTALPLQGSIAAMLLMFTMYWFQMTLMQAFKASVPLAVITIFAGHRALRAHADSRSEKLKSA